MRNQIFYVLKVESLRAVTADDVSNIKKERSLSLILEAGFTAKTILLRYTGYREGLAWKPGT